MLDLARLKRIRLMKRPIGQVFFGHTVLAPNYNFLPGIDIQIDGIEKIPDGPVIYAMNHTDRFNYFPFMYRMWKLKERYITVWVKGKYYEGPLVGTFMELTSNLPTVSRGYIITKDFTQTVGRRPKQLEYDTLRDVVNNEATPGRDPSTVDLDFTRFSILTSRIEQEQTYWTQEVRFESPEDAGPLAWRAGMFASYKDTDGDTTRGYPDRFGNPLTEQTRFDIEESNVAGYGRLTYQSTERLTWEAGGRLEYGNGSVRGRIDFGRPVLPPPPVDRHSPYPPPLGMGTGYPAGT